MTAENIYSIAIHLPKEEMEKLYSMLGKKMNADHPFKKTKKQTLTRQEAIDYLLKNVFSKK